MSEVKSEAVAGAVRYMQQYKGQYSLDDLKQELRSSGYTESVIFEAETQVFAAPNKNDARVSSVGPIFEYTSTGKKIGDFFLGFLGYYILNIVISFAGLMLLGFNFGLGLLSLGVSIYLYFYFRKKRKYISRGILTAFVLSVVLIIAFIIFLIIFFGGF